MKHLSILFFLLLSNHTNAQSVEQVENKHDNYDWGEEKGATLTDMDGNIYSTVTIGTQIWMASNLLTTKYNDGTAIPLVTDKTSWSKLSTPGYCWYSNDEATYKSTYGALYNWYTVNTGKLCPNGWHIPGQDKWTVLMTFLGGESVAGGKLKETGISHWLNPNRKATNETGFGALPGGFRFFYNGNFLGIGRSGSWWSSQESSKNGVSHWSIYSGFSSLLKFQKGSKIEGYSVRCLKD